MTNRTADHATAPEFFENILQPIKAHCNQGLFNGRLIENYKQHQMKLGAKMMKFQICNLGAIKPADLPQHPSDLHCLRSYEEDVTKRPGTVGREKRYFWRHTPR